MSSQENMSAESNYGLDPDQLMTMKLSSSKQFALGALVVAQNALVNTTVSDIKSRDQIQNVLDVMDFLRNSMEGAFMAVTEMADEAMAACGPQVTVENSEGIKL